MLKRLGSTLQSLNRGQRGITGLETAIVLIAFVVVSSVFAFAVLSTGLFSSDQAKETINSGLRETQGTLKLEGAVLADATITSNSTENQTGDGSTTAFTLANGPLIPGSLSVTVGGSAQTEGTDYTVNDYNNNTPTVTFTSAPAGSSTILFTYDYYSVDNVVFQVTNSAGGRAVDLQPGETVITYKDKDNRAVLDAAGEYTLSWLGTNDGDTLVETNEVAQITVPVSSYNLYRSKEFTIEVKPKEGAVLNVTRKIPASIVAQMNLN